MSIQTKFKNCIISGLGSFLRALPLFPGKAFLTRTMLRPLFIGKNVTLDLPLATEPHHLKLRTRIDDWIPWNVFVHGYYLVEEDQERFMLEKAAASVIIFDIGANVGYYTLKFAKFGKDKVYAFEPVSYQHDVLKENLELNCIENVRLAKNIVSGQSGTQRIFFSSEYDTGTSSMIKPTDNFEDVESISLDAFFKEHSLPSIDLVKIDVEGHEAQVLFGMKEILQNQLVKHLFVEINEQNLAKADSSSEDICSYMSKFGYSPYAIRSEKIEPYRLGENESLVYFTYSVPLAY